MIHKTIPTYWYRSNNFGDKINPILMEFITGHKSGYTEPTEPIEHISMIGSILEACGDNTHVWGTGFCYEDSPVCNPKEIYATRGRLSANKFRANGIECPQVYGDPALLLPKFINAGTEKKYKVGIIPHLCDLFSVTYAYSNKYDDCKIINLWDSVENVITQICQCEMTISSALHGLIASHAYGIPSLWVEFSDGVLGNGFKFRDYFTTVQTNETAYNMRNFPDISEILHEAETPTITTNLDLLITKFPQIHG
jgi:pyruvyltransferase